MDSLLYTAGVGTFFFKKNTFFNSYVQRLPEFMSYKIVNKNFQGTRLHRKIRNFYNITVSNVKWTLNFDFDLTSCSCRNVNTIASCFMSLRLVVFIFVVDFFAKNLKFLNDSKSMRRLRFQKVSERMRLQTNTISFKIFIK